MRRTHFEFSFSSDSISIHAPAKGATGTLAYMLRSLYFNPRTREGCDVLTVAGYVGNTISIHAPAKGATEAYALRVVQAVISIHAPAKGATVNITDAQKVT